MAISMIERHGSWLDTYDRFGKRINSRSVR